ncbi:hypothetical protein [Thioclava marina]|nr:hypothetical protein [Thioclava marina]
MSKPDPTRYRTTNWKSYNEAENGGAIVGHGSGGMIRLRAA